MCLWKSQLWKYKRTFPGKEEARGLAFSPEQSRSSQYNLEIKQTCIAVQAFPNFVILDKFLPLVEHIHSQYKNYIIVSFLDQLTIVPKLKALLLCYHYYYHHYYIKLSVEHLAISRKKIVASFDFCLKQRTISWAAMRRVEDKGSKLGNQTNHSSFLNKRLW